MLISRLPEKIQKCFCTPDGAMDPTFQMNPPSSMLLAGETVSSEWFSKVRVFFQHPLDSEICDFWRTSLSKASELSYLRRFQILR